MFLEYIGHSAFYLETQGKGVLTDPFISQNHLANFDWTKKNITDILLTHAHSDHLGDAIEISKTKNAQITAVFELANYCSKKGAKALPTNLGGEVKLDFGSVWFLPAEHSSSTPDGIYGGCASSILIKIEGKKIFHAGDTALTKEFEQIGRIYAPDLALLPIGGHFTMGIDEAVEAAKMLRAAVVIPIHYNTFDIIKADPIEFKTKLEKVGINCLPLKPAKRQNCKKHRNTSERAETAMF